MGGGGGGGGGACAPSAPPPKMTPMYPSKCWCVPRLCAVPIKKVLHLTTHVGGSTHIHP